MPLSFPGRWESQFTVPSGGASVSATVANGGSAATVTVPAASYYLTAAGSISGLIATLQSQLNASTNGYAQTAAAAAAMFGYGDFTSGAAWLCQEASGNLDAVFGSQTLTASNTPTYGVTGPGNGGDLAIGLNSNNDGFAAGAAATFDVDGSSDLVLAAVVKFAALPAATMYIAAKNTFSGTEGNYALAITTTGAARLDIRDTSADGNTRIVLDTSGTMNTDEWYVVIGVLERATDTMRVAFESLSTGTQSVSTDTDASTIGSLANATTAFRLGVGAYSTTLNVAAMYIATGSGAATGFTTNLATAVTNFSNAVNAAWTVSLDTSGGTGRVTIDWTGYATPTWSLTWTSTNPRDMLGFDADISNATSATTGAKQAKGLWFPDSPMNCDDHPSMAPPETDLRTTESPTGVVLGLSGTEKLAHHNVRYRRVPVDRIREASATYANASLEVFFRDAFSGMGHSWFEPASRVSVYWNNAGSEALLGADDSVSGWKAVGFSKFSDICKVSQEGWHGQFDVRFPRLVSDG